MEAEQIAEKARNSLGKYCMEECKAYCCRKGYLVLKEEQVDEVTQGRKNELEQKQVLKPLKDGKYSLYLSRYETPCPSLKEFKCTIHKSDKRPQACKDFPIFIEGKNVKLSPRCLAVKENILYPYVKQLMAKGYKITKGDSIADIELYAVDIK